MLFLNPERFNLDNKQEPEERNPVYTKWGGKEKGYVINLDIDQNPKGQPKLWQTAAIQWKVPDICYSLWLTYGPTEYPTYIQVSVCDVVCGPPWIRYIIANTNVTEE